MTMKKSTSTNYGCHYFKSPGVYSSDPESQYSFKVYLGPQKIDLESGDCCFYLSEDKKDALLARGKKKIASEHFATVIRGYAPPEKSAQLNTHTNLPYVNGCSTRQIFPPERPGDPTWQMLKMPAGTSEQIHHIHPTARAVYIYKGSGISIVGTPSNSARQQLKPGMVCVLEPMCPHHFETQDEELIVLPVHIWSSISGLDFQHPMYHGTHRIDRE